MKRINRKTLPKWTRTLNARQIKHLANDAGGLSIAKLKRNLAGQTRGTCFECSNIGFDLEEAGILPKWTTNGHWPGESNK